VTPASPEDLEGTVDRIITEITFVKYLKDKGLSTCGPIPTKNGDYVIVDSGMIIVISEYARGIALPHTEKRWLNDDDVVFAWGSWLAKLHVLSKLFEIEFPLVALKVRDWTLLHRGIMKDALLDDRDRELIGSDFYGISHGDLNCSNFFYVPEENELSVFDWDQLCKGWFLYDIAQVVFGPYMSGRTGVSDENDKSVVDFEDLVIRGYESVRGEGYVDRDALQRMVLLRRLFYETFCRKAVQELEETDPMFGFCKMVVDFMDREIDQNISPNYR